jgi:flavin reductase (DIM6/NTAB) family NADH-FMN oxidoreductase RutF
MAYFHCRLYKAIEVSGYLHLTMVCEVSGSHGGEYEDESIIGYIALCSLVGIH